MSLPGSGIPVFKMKLAETGKIRDIKKIIARIQGLPSCMYGQLVEFGDGVRGIVMGFDPQDVLVLVLGDENKLRIGKEVTGVNEPFTIPVGEKFLGRMVTALGEPCDGKPRVIGTERRPVFRNSPTITDRAPVDEFLHTGTKIVDCFVPLGKGQRELIIGDRMTGKTVVATDAIIDQKGKDVICVYCVVGKSMTALEKMVSTLHEKGALDYTIIMLALDNSPVGEQYLVPYAAASMGDYFAAQGKDVLVVFDDLTKHAWAYRQLSLLLERPPGREAYPGDIFYIHTQLLERAGRLNDKLGGGTMSFLGIAETLEGDLTGYIPSNLISICDGLIYLSGAMMGEGIRPAIDFMLSVSISGGRTQPAILKELASELRVQYAQYAEVVKLSKLQATLSHEAERVVRRGDALRSILQQGQYEPVPMEAEVMLLYAAQKGRLDTLGQAERTIFSEKILPFARETNPALLEEIAQKLAMTPEIARGLDSVLDAFFSSALSQATAGTAEGAGAAV